MPKQKNKFRTSRKKGKQLENITSNNAAIISTILLQLSKSNQKKSILFFEKKVLFLL
jgi:hypothetical protein